MGADLTAIGDLGIRSLSVGARRRPAQVSMSCTSGIT